MKKMKKTVWYARGGGISKTNPFNTQEEASKCLLLHGSTKPRPLFPNDAFVWSETIEVEEIKKDDEVNEVEEEETKPRTLFEPVCFYVDRISKKKCQL